MKDKKEKLRSVTQAAVPKTKIGKKNSISYSKWGYLFTAPFFVVFIIFSLIPLLLTFYYSFFEYYSIGLLEVGPNFVGFDNYAEVFKDVQFFKYLGNTVIMWLLGFIPQILVSLLLAVIFTDARLKLKFTGFFKTVIYMPNLVMASAFAMLFLTIFSANGPVASMLEAAGVTERLDILGNVWQTRSLIALMNFLMWFGNTTILLMAGVMGIDPGLFDAARIDGANSWQVFFRITLPLLKPILIYVLLTSLIGGIQMFDIPQIFTQGTGSPVLSSMTVIMYLYKLIGTSKNYGMAGAVSVILFVIVAVLSLVVFKSIYKSDKKGKKIAPLRRGKNNG